jgi:cyclopropane fatty-acyl-phospholipid synthase-like methyltransferase
MTRAWYEGFFEGLVLDVWREAIPPAATRAECDFLERELELGPGARVLDVPCGDGRLAVPLAARGYQLTGVDLSAGQIAAARRRPASGGAAVEWLEAEMRDLPWTDRFDAAYCFGNSFGYLDPAGTRAFLRAVARALRPGARFALDTGMAAECILPRFEPHQRAEVGDILFVEENRYRVEESCIETVYTLTRGEEKVTRTGLQWVFTLREIRALFEGAGLRMVGCYGSVTRDAFALGSPVAVLVAEKRLT